MDKAEAKSILAFELSKYRQKSYSDLIGLIDRTEGLESHAPSGTRYQLKFFAAWDDKPNEVLRVFGAIDDGGWRAYSPLTDSFLMKPDGTFLGE